MARELKAPSASSAPEGFNDRSRRAESCAPRTPALVKALQLVRSSW